MLSCNFIIRRGSTRSRIASVGTGVLGLSLFAGIGVRAQNASQDVAAAARQEKARKAEQVQSAAHAETHVYTNEDLRRSHILSEEDGVRVAARKQNVPRPSDAAAANSPASEAPNSAAGESLGAVARRYRQQKSEREAKQAGRIPANSQFHLAMPAEALAEISPVTVPRVAPSQPAAALRAPGAVSVNKYALRRDPFSRPTMELLRKGFNSANGSSVRSAVKLEGPASRSKVAVPAVANSATTTTAAPTPATTTTPSMTTTPVARTPVLVGGVRVSAAPVLATAARSAGVAAAAPETAGAIVATKPVVSLRERVAVAPASAVGLATVKTQAGDSLWKLSRRYSGNGARWREWLRENPRLGDPRLLRVGAVLVVPVRENPGVPGVGTAARAAAQTVGVVRSGDSLWKISAERYGDGALWPCLVRANSGVRDPDRIYPGQMLMVPAACGKAVSVLRNFPH